MPLLPPSSAPSILTTSRILSMAQLARQMEWRKDTPAAALCLWIGTTTTDTVTDDDSRHHHTTATTRAAITNTTTTTCSLAMGFRPRRGGATTKMTQELLRIDSNNNNGGGYCSTTTTTTAQSIHDTLQHHPDLPLVVGWPLQTNVDDSGTSSWGGAACGRVLHILDRIPDTSRRTVTLYTPPSVNNNNNDDYRTATRTTTQQCHVASREQYQQHAFAGYTTQTATDLWRLVCADVWPTSARHTLRTANMEEDHDNDWDSMTATTGRVAGSSASPPPPPPLRRSLVQAAA